MCSFLSLRKQHDDPVLHLYGSPIPVVEESKFLGILFDSKLSLIPHINCLKAKCNSPFTVRHFLLECGDFAQVRNNCFHVDNMKELFQDIHIDSIMTFLR